MSEKTDHNDVRKVHVEAEKFKELQHHVTVRGEAEDYGIIASNSGNLNDQESNQSEKKKKKQLFEQLLIEQQRWFDEFLRDLDNRINEVEMQVSATEKLLNMLERGEDDFASPESVLLLQQAHLTKDQVLELGPDGLSIHIDNLKVLKSHLETVKELAAEIDTNDLDQIREFSKNFGTVGSENWAQAALNKTLADMEDPNEIFRIQETRSFSQNDLQIQQQVSTLKAADNLDSFFDTAEQLSSDQLTDNPIKTSVQLGADFERASNPVQQTSRQELKEKPEFNHSNSGIKVGF